MEKESFKGHVDFNERIRKLAIIQGRCAGHGGFLNRTRRINELMRHVPSDSMGGCTASSVPPRVPLHGMANGPKAREYARSKAARPSSFHRNKMANIRGYMFSLAFENARLDDWVTEKVYQALAVGSVPVYWGAPNILDFLPCENCIIDATRFGSMRKLGEHLTALIADEEEYEKLLEWTRTPFRPERHPLFWHRVANRSFDSSMCAICVKLRGTARCDCARPGCTPRQRAYSIQHGKHG